MTVEVLYDDPEVQAIVEADVARYGVQALETHRHAIAVFGLERATAQMRSTMDNAALEDPEFMAELRAAISRQAERLKELEDATADGTLHDLIKDFPTVREQIESLRSDETDGG